MLESPVSSFEAAYQAAGKGAALFDLDDWTSITLSGKDVLTFLQNISTNDMAALAVGAGCETFLTNVKARVVAHGLIFRLADEQFQLLSAPAQGPTILAHLDKYIISEDVALEDQSAARGLVGVVGPSGAALLEQIGAPAPSAGEAHRLACVETDLDGEDVRLFTFDGLQQPAILVETAREQLEALADRLIDAGAIRAGLDVFNGLRIEAVYPASGIDLTDKHLAPEVDRPWTISLDKGCFLGQEPIARIDAMGHVNRLLRGVRLDEETVPEAGAPLFDGEKKLGEVRSSATSGQDGKVIALAFVRASHAAPGTRVTVGSGDLASAASVFKAE